MGSGFIRVDWEVDWGGQGLVRIAKRVLWNITVGTLRSQVCQLDCLPIKLTSKSVGKMHPSGWVSKEHYNYKDIEGQDTL